MSASRDLTHAVSGASLPAPTPRPRFGDIIENGWASEDNPTRAGFFVREGRRTGRMNAGRYYEVTDGAGKFWELPSFGDHKIIVRPKIAEPSSLRDALEAAYTFITQPQQMHTPKGGPKTATYRIEGYNALTAKLRAAIDAADTSDRQGKVPGMDQSGASS